MKAYNTYNGPTVIKQKANTKVICEDTARFMKFGVYM